MNLPIKSKFMASLTPEQRARLIAAGELAGGQLHFPNSTAFHAALASGVRDQTSEASQDIRAKSVRPLASDLRPLTPAERETILSTYCRPCEFNRNGRCSKCKHCGGGRRIEDMPTMTSSKCPVKKWGNF